MKAWIISIFAIYAIPRINERCVLWDNLCIVVFTDLDPLLGILMKFYRVMRNGEVEQ